MSRRSGSRDIEQTRGARRGTATGARFEAEKFTDVTHSDDPLNFGVTVALKAAGIDLRTLRAAVPPWRPVPPPWTSSDPRASSDPMDIISSTR